MRVDPTKREWRPVPGYPGIAVSEDGLVMCLEHIKGSKTWPGELYARFRAGPKTRKMPYWCVTYKKGAVAVRKLVLTAFVGPAYRNAKRFAIHLDGNADNLHYTNLKWVSASARGKYYRDMGFRIPPYGNRHPKAKLTRDDAWQIRLRYARNETQRELAEDFGVSKFLVQQIIKGKRWKHVPMPTEKA